MHTYIRSNLLSQHFCLLLGWIYLYIWADSFTSKHYTFFLYPVIFLTPLLFVLTFPTSYLAISKQKHLIFSVPYSYLLWTRLVLAVYLYQKICHFFKEIRNTTIELVDSSFKAFPKAQKLYKIYIKIYFSLGNNLVK